MDDYGLVRNETFGLPILAPGLNLIFDLFLRLN